jgi:hypothetical protein
MIAAVALAKIYGFGPVDRALATAAELGRFADEDLVQLMRHQATRAGKVRQLDDMRSLQGGTAAWAGFGSSAARHHRHCQPSSRRSCAGCTCPTCGAPHPKYWPPPTAARLPT